MLGRVFRQMIILINHAAGRLLVAHKHATHFFQLWEWDTEQWDEVVMILVVFALCSGHFFVTLLLFCWCFICEWACFTPSYWSLPILRASKSQCRLPWWPSDKKYISQCRRMGLIPDLRRSCMPGSNQAYLPQLLSLCSRARELQLLKPDHPRTHTLQQDKPPQWKAHVLQLETSPHPLQLEKACGAMKIQHGQINKLYYMKKKIPMPSEMLCKEHESNKFPFTCQMLIIHLLSAEHHPRSELMVKRHWRENPTFFPWDEHIH